MVINYHDTQVKGTNTNEWSDMVSVPLSPKRVCNFKVNYKLGVALDLKATCNSRAAKSRYLQCMCISAKHSHVSHKES